MGPEQCLSLYGLCPVCPGSCCRDAHSWGDRNKQRIAIGADIRMDEWCTNQHGKSGLTAACIASPLTYEDVTKKVLEYIQKWVPERGAALLAGSTVHADMRWVQVCSQATDVILRQSHTDTI